MGIFRSCPKITRPAKPLSLNPSTAKLTLRRIPAEVMQPHQILAVSTRSDEKKS